MHQTTLAHTQSRLTMINRLFGSAFAALVPSLAALPAAAQIPTWIQQQGTDEIDHTLAAAYDGSGGVYVGGYTGGSLGGPSAGNTDAWFARYDNAGNQLWKRQ